MPVLSAAPLTRAQLQSFERDGFLIVPGVLAREEIDEINALFLSQARRGPVPGMFEGSPDAPAADPLARYPRMMHPHRQPQLPVGPIAQRYMLDARIEAVLTDLLGEQPIAAQSMYYFKPPGARGQALHQDNFYLRVRPHSCIAAWIALDDADRENGGMVVVPGSHRHPVACPEQADPAISFSNDFVRAPAGLSERAVDLRAGDALFFGGELIHGSYPNASADRFRRAFISHYMPQSATEISEWYVPMMTFDGAEVARAKATGGGPCGTEAIAQGPH